MALLEEEAWPCWNRRRGLAGGGVSVALIFKSSHQGPVSLYLLPLYQNVKPPAIAPVPFLREANTLP